LDVVPVLQNHQGKAISTLEDFETVLAGINDPRMKTLLEVGQFHSVGVDWRDGYKLLQGTIALIHIKDQIGSQSVPFGTGEIDLPGLFKHMKQEGYQGNFVVEMEVADKENTLRYLEKAFHYVQNL
jgi:sugar phosphate isomerase/epimerase